MSQLQRRTSPGTRRLPDRYVQTSVRSARRASGTFNTEQFEFLKDVPDLRPGGEKRSRRGHP